MKTEETKRLEMAIWRATHNQGTFGCFEVTIGWFGKERVDYMTFNTKNEFRCYEIKVTKADFNSPCHKSFVGDLNYYVMPLVLYEQVKGKIPEWVGVYASSDGKTVTSVKKAKRKQNTDRETLKDSIIRSLCREVTKQIKSGDPIAVEKLNRRINELTREKDDYRWKYWDLRSEVEERFGTRWNKEDSKNG